MTKFLSGCAAAALVMAVSMPMPAGAAGSQEQGLRNVGATDLSAKRKKRKRVVIRRYYDDGPRYGYRTYRSYGYDPYPYRGYGYHRRPGVSVGVGGFGVHID